MRGPLEADTSSRPREPAIDVLGAGRVRRCRLVRCSYLVGGLPPADEVRDPDAEEEHNRQRDHDPRQDRYGYQRHDGISIIAPPPTLTALPPVHITPAG